ncbi:MAG TPA: hypothetical protein VL443_20655 [Cyclobacteriaceae bacterium]|jgi:hypothetical protein|nr:hypothetical protein [Cyclobacteriaceae bacterium]
MTKEKIVASTSMELFYQPEDSILIVRFHGFLKPAEAFKDRLLLNDTIRQKKIQLLVINQRDIKVLSSEMQSFIVKTASEMVKHGIKKIATVLPEDVFALAGVSKIQNEFHTPGIEIANFASEESGVNWLCGRFYVL